MKKLQSFYTLIEMMVVLGIISILFALGTAVFSQATEKSEIAMAKSQIAALVAGIEMYRDRWGQYPTPSGTSIDNVNTPFNFAEWLSKVAPGADGWDKDGNPATPDLRPMFVKYNELGFDVGNTSYDAHNATTTTLYDPWGSPYSYYYDATSESFIVYSIGTYEDISGNLEAEFDSGAWKFKEGGI